MKIPFEKEDFQLNNLLMNQLIKGATVIERIEAARLLKKSFSYDILDSLQKVIIHDPFYGVSVEAINTIGSFYDKSDFKKSECSYQILKRILSDKKLFEKLNPQVKKALIKNVGIFEREHFIDFLLNYCKIGCGNVESDFIVAESATALGKSSRFSLSSYKISKIKPLLIQLINLTNSFQNVIAVGALGGLKAWLEDTDAGIVLDVADILIQNTDKKMDYFIRSYATLALGDILKISNRKNNSKIEHTKNRTLMCLIKLLKDPRRHIKVNACKALDNENKPTITTNSLKRIYKAIDALIIVSESDLDGFVRRRAETHNYFTRMVARMV